MDYIYTLIEDSIIGVYPALLFGGVTAFLVTGYFTFRKLNKRRISDIEKSIKEMFDKAAQNFVYSDKKITFPPVLTVEDSKGSDRGRKITVSMSKKGIEYIDIFTYLNVDPAETGTFQISRETKMSRLKEKSGRGDFHSGDYIFDDIFLLKSSGPRGLTALLGSDLRRKLQVLAQYAAEMEITNYSLRAALSLALMGDTPGALVKCINLCFEICRLFTETNVKDMLVRNINEERFPEIRLANIQCCTARYPVDDAVRAALEKALGSEEMAVQIEAARHLGDEGMEHLVMILNGITEGNIIYAHGIIKILREAGYWKSNQLLEDLFINAEDRKLKIEILQAFHDSCDAAREPFLVRQLDNEDREVLLNAVHALGTCGTMAVVEKLHALSRSSRLSALAAAAHNAIVIIQDKYGAGDRGWLSTAEKSEKEGGLTFADSAAEGSLSINEEAD